MAKIKFFDRVFLRWKEFELNQVFSKDGDTFTLCRKEFGGFFFEKHLNILCLCLSPSNSSQYNRLKTENYLYRCLWPLFSPYFCAVGLLCLFSLWVSPLNFWAICASLVHTRGFLATYNTWKKTPSLSKRHYVAQTSDLPITRNQGR